MVVTCTSNTKIRSSQHEHRIHVFEKTSAIEQYIDIGVCISMRIDQVQYVIRNIMTNALIRAKIFYSKYHVPYFMIATSLNAPPIVLSDFSL